MPVVVEPEVAPAPVEIERIEIVPLQPWQEYLLRAADWLEEHDWLQGDWVKEEYVNNRIVPVAACAIGAIRVVVPEADRASVRYRLKKWLQRKGVMTILRRRNEATGELDVEMGTARSVPAWNDGEGRTKDEVVAGMREAALL